MVIKRSLLFAALISLIVLGLWLPVNAAPAAQLQFQTPTPGADGRITYVAIAGDTCTRITLLMGITEDQSRQLNRLDQNCTIVEGQEYVIAATGSGTGTATAGPSPTPAAPTITPTPFTGTTEICVLLFDDVNGDAQRQETEPALAGGAVSVSENNGEYSASQVTVINPDPEAYQGICFSGVPEGVYTVSVAIPDLYNPTMLLSYELDVKAGDTALVDFGAQSRETTVNQPDGGGIASPLLGIFGILLVLGGGVLGYFAWISGKPESKLAGSNLVKGKFLKGDIFRKRFTKK